MKILCPRCSKGALLADDYSKVECSSCGMSITYVEYLDVIVARSLGSQEKMQ